MNENATKRPIWFSARGALTIERSTKGTHDCTFFRVSQLLCAEGCGTQDTEKKKISLNFAYATKDW